MHQIARIYGTDTYNIVVGPLLSAGDALTPYTGLTEGEFDSISFINPIGIISDVKAQLTFFSEIGNGYYGIFIDSSTSAIDSNGSYKISMQAAGKILPYNMDLMILHPDYYYELINGPILTNTAINLIYRQVSGSTNISTQLSATQAQVVSYGGSLSTTVGSIDSKIDTLKNTDVPAVKLDTSLILSKITKVGSISADIISGGVLKKAGTTIKDIEVRDNRVYVSYRDPTDGKMKVYDQLFTQDIVIASGGDLLV